jgi:hypothetical protein
MGSLKQFTTQLAPWLGLTPAALYERQRALVRLGLLPRPEKAGPRGGIQATPNSVAMLLIACLATDNLSEIGAQVGKFARTKPSKDLCPLTGASSLAEALTRILSDRDLARRVGEVVFYRQHGMAQIIFGADKGARPLRWDPTAPTSPRAQLSVFRFKAPFPGRFLFQVRASLDGQLLEKIAEDIHQEQ